ncbi:MAG: hypothetical protein IPM48_03575 [Saprospiraceae bacterium]|nr:hypothetical protein [Saprospiraceae bacterium]
MAFELRQIEDTIVLDVVPLDHYDLLGFQFAIEHSSPEVDFLEVKSTLPNYDRNLRFNEVCKNVIRNLWASPDLSVYPFSPGNAFLSFYFIEKTPTRHFIRILPSRASPGNKCNHMLREFLGFNGKQYYLPDVQIDYEIQNNQLIILNQSEVRKPIFAKLYLSSDQQSVLVEPIGDFVQGKASIAIFDLSGKQILLQVLENAGPWQIKLPAQAATSGLLTYRLLLPDQQVQAGKLMIK